MFCLDIVPILRCVLWQWLCGRLFCGCWGLVVNKAGRSTASLLTPWPRWGYLVTNLAHPGVMPPRRRSDGKSRATLCRQGTRLGKRQRAEARELEQMRSHDRVALPAAPPRSSAGSSMDHLQQPARPAPAEGKGASAQVELPQHVGTATAPCGCHPGRWPYTAPYCPPMLPLQYLRPSVEEGRIGEAWAEPVPPAPAPVVATTGAEPLAHFFALGQCPHELCSESIHVLYDSPSVRGSLDSAGRFAGTGRVILAQLRARRRIRPPSHPSGRRCTA